MKIAIGKAIPVKAKISQTGLANAAVPYIEKRLGSEDVVERWCAIRALGHTQIGEAAPILARVLKQDSNNELRRWAAIALEENADRKALPILLDVTLDDPSAPPELRIHACYAATQLATPSEAPDLLYTLDDPWPAVAKVALDGIGRIKDPSSIAGVIAVLSDPRPEIRNGG